MAAVNQPETVQKQYQMTNNLNTRISVHEKYSTNKTGFGNWLFSHYDFSPGNKILELGCGTGDLWKSKLHLLDRSTLLTLTDLSENMVHATKNTLGNQNNISYAVVNIEEIPYNNN